MKARGEKIAALTAYDFPMTKLLDEAGIPLILVGDSLGMVVLGYPDTTHVTMAEMEHHVRAAARARPWRIAWRGHAVSQLRKRDPADAIYSAARLLCADGGGDPAHLYAAIFDYNHSDAYVSLVLAYADEYAGSACDRCRARRGRAGPRLGHLGRRRGLPGHALRVGR